MSATTGFVAGWAGSALRSAAPLLWALLGETLAQRVAVVNLGVEGQMLVGALAGFATAAVTGNPWLGLAAAAAAGLLLSCLHAALCVNLRANAFASGLAVWMLGFGLSSFAGAGFVGRKIEGFRALGPGPWDRIPAFGPLLDQLTPTVTMALLLSPALGFWLYRTRAGLRWRSVGENPQAARAAGLRPGWIQWQGILAGGLLTGLGGACLSVDYTRNWVEGMTAGRGLVAVGLVIVARWNPFLALPAALLFGGTEAFTLKAQTLGLPVSPYLLQTLPYLVCLAVLAASSVRARRDAGMPAGLKAVFQA